MLEKNFSGIPYCTFVFGSQANKALLKRSDIDVGIIAENKITPQQLSKISAEIEDLPMLYKVDLVNFEDTDSGFRAIAIQNIELL